MTEAITVPARAAWLSWRLPGVLVLSLVLGGATSWGQFLLPEGIVSIANSSSGWTLITALLVSVARLPLWPSVVAGAGSFVLLTVGYALVSDWRGFFYDPTFFVVVGVIVGPFVGAAAAWIRGCGVPAALASALLAGIGVGEAVYGLTVVADSTSPVYWWIIGSAGVLLLGGMTGWRLRGVYPRLIAVVGTLLVAGAFLATYTTSWSF